MIKIINVSKKFKNKIIYENINIHIKKGECIGIIGANGTGKSVLFKMITGLEYANSGSIYVRGKLVGKNENFPKNVGLFVNQPGYIEYYDGFTNLKMLAEIKNIITDEDIKEKMLKIGLNPDDKTKVKNYSAGMKQKLGITQAIMENQDIILLDEPFNALDFKTNNDVMNILTDLKRKNNTILLTSHQHNYLEKICDKMFIILDKQILLLDENIKNEYFSS